MNLNKNKKILIIDFGSQVTQLIARRIRELAVYCEIISYQKFNKLNSRSIICKSNAKLCATIV